MPRRGPGRTVARPSTRPPAAKRTIGKGRTKPAFWIDEWRVRLLRLGGLAVLAMVLLLGDARRLAAPSAQVIELGATHLAAAHDLHRVDHRRKDREDALDALAVGDLAHGEILVEAGAGAPDADALIGLDAGTLALDHLDVDDQRVARLEVGNLLAGGEL